MVRIKTMRIFFVAYFVEPPQDLVPYAQRVVRVMGAAALLPPVSTSSRSQLDTAPRGRQGARARRVNEPDGLIRRVALQLLLGSKGVRPRRFCPKNQKKRPSGIKP